MADLGAIVAQLKAERAKLDKAIAVLQELAGTNTVTLNGRGHKRTLSVAARNKIAKAQKLRWIKLPLLLHGLRHPAI